MVLEQDNYHLEELVVEGHKLAKKTELMMWYRKGPHTIVKLSWLVLQLAIFFSNSDLCGIIGWEHLMVMNCTFL